jgi:hypothetical protein
MFKASKQTSYFKSIFKRKKYELRKPAICPILDTSLFPNFLNHGFENPYAPKTAGSKKRISRRRTYDTLYPEEAPLHPKIEVKPLSLKEPINESKELGLNFVHAEKNDREAQPENILNFDNYQNVHSRNEIINLLNLKDAMVQRTTIRNNIELLSKISEEEISSEGDFEFPEVKMENEQFIKYYKRNNKGKNLTL